MLPPIIREAFDRFQKVLVDFHYRKARANQVFPNPAVTGPAGYKNMQYKQEKAHRIEKIGYENLEKASKALERTMRRYLDRKIGATPKPIDFVAENLNSEIAKIRKEFKPHLSSIKKAYNGTQKGRKYNMYHLVFNDKKYDLELKETGCFWFRLHDAYNQRKIVTLSSVKEMMDLLRKCLSKINEQSQIK